MGSLNIKEVRIESINGENQATAMATLDSCGEFLLGKPDQITETSQGK
jgi:hypothetical protein